MSLRSGYDAWHGWRQAADPDHDDSVSPWYQLLGEYLGDVKGLDVLEVACGRGGLTPKLALAGCRVTGCDFSAAAMAATRHKTREVEPRDRIRLVQADAQQLPFATASFDVVISCETIKHLPNVQAALREMHRVTRNGGRLFLTTPNYANFMGLYDLYARVRHPNKRDDQGFDRRQWFAQILRWVRRAGWKILTTDGTVHQFPFVPGRSPLRWQALEANRSVRKLLSPFAYTYFVMSRKP